MIRRWKSFNTKVTNQEFLTIPQPDRGELFLAMDYYGLGETHGFVVKNYGGGLMMIKAANRTQGRCLFFTTKEENGVTYLVALLAYKKESQEAPKRVIETARARMKEYGT